MNLALFRGLPGVGKSRAAQVLVDELNYLNFEADQYQADGQGIIRKKFDRNKLQPAHNLCRARCQNALLEKCSVVISNTMSTLEEIRPYVAMGVKYHAGISIVCFVGNWGCPRQMNDSTDIYDNMKQRWEGCPGELIMTARQFILTRHFETVVPHHINQILGGCNIPIDEIINQANQQTRI